MGGVNIFLTVLSVVSTVCAIIFGYLAYKRNEKHDIKGEGEKDGTILTKLGYIKSGVDDIKHKQEKQDDQISKVLERLSYVESSAKQAHHRIDTLEQQMYKK